MFSEIFFYAIYEELKLKYPVSISYKKRKKYDACGEYYPVYSDNGKLEGHEIILYPTQLKEDERDVDTIVAHELIHAWQTEKNYWEEHGKHFRRMAKRIAKKYDKPLIYVPGTDD